MEIDLKLPYSPSVSLDSITNILDNEFPECKTVRERNKTGEFIRLKKTFFVHACIYISHDIEKEYTIVGIDGNMSNYAYYLFGSVFHYIYRGSFLIEIKQVLEDTLLT